METNKHHLFTKIEIRAKLIEILGRPRNDNDRRYLKNEINWAHKLIPRFKINKETHRLIHLREQLRNKTPPQELINGRIERSSSKASNKSKTVAIAQGFKDSNGSFHVEDVKGVEDEKN